VSLISIAVFMLITPGAHTSYSLFDIKEIFPIFRFILCIIFTIMCAGVVIGFLKEYRINYVIIFESNPANRLAPSAMYILSAILMIIWLFCLIGEIMNLKDYISTGLFFFAILLLVIFL
jgi:hypothetical protein